MNYSESIELIFKVLVIIFALHTLYNISKIRSLKKNNRFLANKVQLLCCVVADLANDCESGQVVHSGREQCQMAHIIKNSIEDIFNGKDDREDEEG